MGLDGMAYYTIFTPEGDDGWDSRDGYDDGVLWCGADKKMVHEFLDSVTSGKTTRTDLSSALKSHLICIS